MPITSSLTTRAVAEGDEPEAQEPAEETGGFEPLASVSGEKKVVLGLVTTKRPELESKDAVIARIHEAAKYLPLDRLCLSPQCGFASCEIGNKLTEAQQWAKLALVKEIAEEVWG